MAQQKWMAAFGMVVAVGMGIFLSGCRSTNSIVSFPSIQNINSATTPTSSVGLPIEINGTGFQAAPGKVTFTQGSVSMDVVPAASSWSATGIVALVPMGNVTTNFTLPGTVSVTVTTSGGTSTAVTLNLVATVSFNPSGMTWGTTMALPKALSGLRAVGVPGTSSTTAFAIVTGGYDITSNANTTTVWSNNLNPDGTVGSATNTTWTTIATSPLPSTLAHHAMAEADDSNSLVASGQRYIYVIGGQVHSADTPGGTNTIYMASVNATTGVVGTWTTLTSNLPQALVGESATVHNGYLYVAGGLFGNNNIPTSAVYSAPVNSDGTIGTWATATNTLLTARAFGTMFVSGGVIYYINGDPNNSGTLNAQGVGDMNVFFASAVRGAVGVWQLNSNLTIHDRAKGVVYNAFGQVIAAEGVYSGAVGSGEMETASINAANMTSSALNGWSGLTGAAVPGANVYNAAGFTSPLLAPTTNGPRFLLLGGQTFSGTIGVPGALSSAVYYNTAP